MTIDPIGVILLIVIVCLLRERSDRYIALPARKFWHLVHSQPNHVVLLTTKGFLIKRLCYVFPYQGVLFSTHAQGTEAPDGVTLIGVQ